MITLIDYLNEEIHPLLVPPDIRKRLLDKSITPEELDKLADNKDVNVKIQVAKHPNTSIDTLNKLFKLYIPSVETGIASNPNATEELLDHIAYFSKNVYAKVAVAKHKNTSTDALEALTKEDNPFVREAAASNKRTPRRAIKGMMSNDPGVNKAIQK